MSNLWSWGQLWFAAELCHCSLFFWFWCQILTYICPQMSYFGLKFDNVAELSVGSFFFLFFNIDLIFTYIWPQTLSKIFDIAAESCMVGISFSKRCKHKATLNGSLGFLHAFTMYNISSCLIAILIHSFHRLMAFSRVTLWHHCYLWLAPMCFLICCTRLQLKDPVPCLWSSSYPSHLCRWIPGLY